MSHVILHHYPLSPYSEKIRLALGLKGVGWNSVEIPVWTPRPKLTPMTGGYRRTPILWIVLFSQRPPSANPRVAKVSAPSWTPLGAEATMVHGWRHGPTCVSRR